MKYRVTVLKTIRAEETEIGIGATVLLNQATKQIITLLRRKYEEDSSCLEGDIGFLFSFDGVGLKKDDKFFRR